jgi:hypothetical protein
VWSSGISDVELLNREIIGKDEYYGELLAWKVDG